MKPISLLLIALALAACETTEPPVGKIEIYVARRNISKGEVIDVKNATIYEYPDIEQYQKMAALGFTTKDPLPMGMRANRNILAQEQILKTDFDGMRKP